MKKISSKHTSFDIKKWAYLKSKPDLRPQWDEQLATIDNADILLTLASDQDCPRRVYILRCLYFLVGKSASKHVEGDILKIKELLDTVQSSSDNIILNWVQRSRIILQDLRKFDYIEWCQGGFVEKDLPTVQ